MQCKELKGLGDFIIDQTTYKEALKDNNITKPDMLKHSSFSSGFWEVSVIDAWGADYDRYEMATYVEKQATAIKQLEVSDDIYKYKVGEIEIENISLAFYRDTLVAISFDCTSQILNHYISKYGDGKGKYYDYKELRGKNYYKHIHEEERLWTNNILTMEYKDVCNMLTTKNEDTYTAYTTCIIYSNSKYNKFVNELDKAKEAYRKDKEAKVDASLNSL